MLTCEDIGDGNVHQEELYHTQLPKDVSDYTVIFFVRNPYKRVVSAYLDRFRKFYNIKYCFRNFLKIDPQLIDYHHFCPQLSEQYDSDKPGDKHLEPTHVYDIENIDYTLINSLFGVTGINKKDILQGPHTSSYDPICFKFVGDDSLLLDVPRYQYFYDNQIQEDVENIYKRDIDMFEKWGLVYTQPTYKKQLKT